MFKRIPYLQNDDPGAAGGGAPEPAAAAAPAGDPPASPPASEPAAAPAPAAPADPAPEPKSYWPDDWQTKLSKGDEKIAKRLGRYASPEALADALIAAQNRISSGELKAPPPKNATPEQMTEWRKENGIPEKPEDYDLKFDNGLVLGDEDKATVDAYLKHAHERNLPPQVVKDNIAWWKNEQSRQMQARLEQDDVDRETAVDVLMEEWGASYKRNRNMVASLLDAFPESVRDNFKSARLPGGKALFNDPDFLRGMVQFALEINPSGSIAPAGGNQAETVESEMAKIEKVMREDRQAYNKDDKMQARYRELIEAREKLQKRAA